MLREILASLSEGKIFSQYDLAERLHISPEAIAVRLDFLHRSGYLRKICAVKDCGKKCTGCPIANATPENSPAVWEAVKSTNPAAEPFKAVKKALNP
jgi:DNA-binding Lrp family transcriptional regulator